MANKKIVNIAYDNSVSGISADNVQDAIGMSRGVIWDTNGDTGVQTEETPNDDTIRFDTNGAERMIISPTGNVGIGTNDPSENLSLRGANMSMEFESSVHNSGTHSIYFKHGNDFAQGRTAIKAAASGAGSGGSLSFLTSGVSRFEIKYDGKVSSNGELYLRGNARLGSSVNTGVKSLKFAPSEAKAAIFSVPGGSYGRADLRFTVGNNGTSAEKTENDYSMIITKNGDVGIGDAVNPNYKLEVGGEIMLQDTTVPVATSGRSGIYSNSGELYAIDQFGNSTQISPHDRETKEWIYNSKNIKTGDTLRINMQAMMIKLDEMLGGGYVFVNGEQLHKKDNNIKT